MKIFNLCPINKNKILHDNSYLWNSIRKQCHFDLFQEVIYVEQNTFIPLGIRNFIRGNMIINKINNENI